MYIDNTYPYGNTYPFGGNGIGWPYPTDQWPTVQPYVSPYQTTGYISIASTPTECSDNLHVFGCDHAAKCKCGKSTRKPEPPKCAHCGTTHK